MLAAGRESALINREHRQRGPIKRRRYLPSAERKREILDAALIEFSDRGYTATTIETIATRAGLSKTGIYAHYKSKEEVFEDLLMTVLSGFYPVSTDGWVKSLKAWSLASSLRWMSGLWNRSM